MKYYVYRISKISGRKEYKRAKTLDIFVSEKLKDSCWQYSKQGATGIIKKCNDRCGWHYEYGMESVTE